jgi:hypothetical protein
MKTRCVLTILSVLTLPVSSAFAATPVPESTSCIEVPGDAYDPGKVMDFGKYKGQCVDTSIKRPANIISQDDDTITFANFLNDGKYWIARVPKHGVARAIFQIEDFPTGVSFVKAAHTQLRIVMQPGSELELTPQTPTPDSSVAPIKVSDFNWSLEYAAPAGVSYDIFHGELDEYALVERIVSTHDRGSEQILVDKNTVRQYQLKIPTQAELDALLVNGISDSDKVRMDEAYLTLGRNCTTELFNLIDQTVKYPFVVAPFATWIINFLDPIAGPSLDSLQERQLIDSTSELPTLNQETNNGANFPQ